MRSASTAAVTPLTVFIGLLFLGLLSIVSADVDTVMAEGSNWDIQRIFGEEPAETQLIEVEDEVADSAAHVALIVPRHSPSPPSPPTWERDADVSCAKRKEDAISLLVNYQAAKTLEAASHRFGVDDAKARWRVKRWHHKYIAEASKFAFYCQQSHQTADEVAGTIHLKEELRSKKAMIVGLHHAVREENSATFKTYHGSTSEKAAKFAQHQELETKRAIKAALLEDKMRRLHELPQTSKDVVGFVGDASTAKALFQAVITSKCPFQTQTAKTDGIVADGNYAGAYHIASGISGPVGHRCLLTYQKDGYVPLTQMMVINKGLTQALFRQAFLMPKLPEPASSNVWRVVLQYGTVPVDIEAHLQVFPPEDPSSSSHQNGQRIQAYDVAMRRGSRPYMEFTKTGDATQFPYVTLDAGVNTGYGPQSHTIHRPIVGKYAYYVENFDRDFTANEVFHSSDARVFLYQGNQLKQSYSIRSASSDSTPYWTVFLLNCVASSDIATPTCELHETSDFTEHRPDTLRSYPYMS